MTWQNMIGDWIWVVGFYWNHRNQCVVNLNLTNGLVFGPSLLCFCPAATLWHRFLGLVPPTQADRFFFFFHPWRKPRANKPLPYLRYFFAPFTICLLLSFTFTCLLPSFLLILHGNVFSLLDSQLISTDRFLCGRDSSIMKRCEILSSKFIHFYYLEEIL